MPRSAVEPLRRITGRAFEIVFIVALGLLLVALVAQMWIPLFEVTATTIRGRGGIGHCQVLLVPGHALTHFSIDEFGDGVWAIGLSLDPERLGRPPWPTRRWMWHHRSPGGVTVMLGDAAMPEHQVRTALNHLRHEAQD